MAKQYTIENAKNAIDMMTKKIKDRLITAAVIIGFIMAGIALWGSVIVLMWACYAAGIPM